MRRYQSKIYVQCNLMISEFPEITIELFSEAGWWGWYPNKYID